MTITATSINRAAKEAASCGRLVTLKDAEAGLSLRIFPGSARTWVLQMRDRDGKPRRFSLGSHPAVSLSAARERCRQMRQDVREGADPVKDARQRRERARAAERGEGTLRALLDAFAKQTKAGQQSWAQRRRLIDNVFRALLDRPADELTLPDLQRAIDGWPARHSAANAAKALRLALRWASHPGREICPRDLTFVTPDAPPSVRERALDPEELGRLLPVLRVEDGLFVHRDAFRMILLTLVRRSELVDAVWRDIDFAQATWRLPETKSGREHIVALSRQAVALLRKRRDLNPEAGSDDPVFASAWNGGRLGSSWSWSKATRQVQAESQTADWHRHDLRRTSATMLGRNGTPPYIVESVLNHAVVHSKLAMVYNRWRYLPEARIALQQLADAYDRIEAGEQAEIVPLRPITSA
jgi:integrase